MTYEETGPTSLRTADRAPMPPELDAIDHTSELSPEVLARTVEQAEAYTNDPHNASSLQAEVGARGGVDAASAELMRNIEALLLIGNNLSAARVETGVTAQDVTDHRKNGSAA